jgi:peptidoglycan/xylan/chitin deacetylase (PgdA/CDA1 family)
VTRSVPILMYHSVTHAPPPATRALSVRPADLRWQLEYLRDEGFTGLTFADLQERRRTGAELPAKPIALTFDDGYADTHEEALTLLAEYGFAATVFVTTGWLRDAGPDAAGRPLDRTLSWGQVRELADSGIEVAAHSHSHAQLDQLSDRALRAELVVGKALLEDRLGRAVPSLAYPYGYWSRRVRRAVEAAGYTQAAAVSNDAAVGSSDELAVPRLTIRRSTTPEVFAQITACEELDRVFRADRVMTKGFLVVRRARYALRKPLRR